MFNPRAVLAAPAALVLALLTFVPYTSAQGPGTDPAVARLLSSIKARDTGQLAVSEEDGRFLRLMVASSGAKRALEIGGASGYSAIWIGMGLRSTGGKLVTIEYEAARAVLSFRRRRSSKCLENPASAGPQGDSQQQDCHQSRHGQKSCTKT